MSGCAGSSSSSRHPLPTGAHLGLPSVLFRYSATNSQNVFLSFLFFVLCCLLLPTPSPQASCLKSLSRYLFPFTHTHTPSLVLVPLVFPILVSVCPQLDLLCSCVCVLLLLPLSSFDLLHSVSREPLGDILVFLTGQEEIETLVQQLQEHVEHDRSKYTLLPLPLYSGLPHELQMQVLLW